MLPREDTHFQLPTTLLTPRSGVPLLQEKVNILWSFSNKHSASSVFETSFFDSPRFCLLCVFAASSSLRFGKGVMQ